MSLNARERRDRERRVRYPKGSVIQIAPDWESKAEGLGAEERKVIRAMWEAGEPLPDGSRIYILERNL
ncbi:MAG TPA: hypothetical protein VGR63_02425 [Casimicrobiaceae bacterium]|jgi:hypothetical protein|nr:hypothetical protein [Casimicrobiaceae bacterium]